MDSATSGETPEIPGNPAERAPEIAAPPPSSAHVFAGFVALAIVDAFVVAWGLPRSAKIASRALVHVHDALQCVALGLALTALAALLERLPARARRFGGPAAALLFAVLGAVVLRDDMSGPAERMPRVVPLSVWLFALPIAASAIVPLAALIGNLLARRWIRLLGVGLGAALAVAHGVSFSRVYQGSHLFAALASATLMGASLRGAPLVARLWPARLRVRWAVSGLLAALSVGSMATRPSNDVALLLSRRPSAVIEPYLDRTASAARVKRVVPKEQRAWFSDRRHLASIPPSSPRLLPDRPIVLLIGIDSMRADVLWDERQRASLPTLFSLRDRGTYFTAARAAGSSTAPSLAALFASRSYSMLYWTSIRHPRFVLPFPHADATPRFPTLLAEAGVTTFTADGAGWLGNDFGVVRGFTEQHRLGQERRFAFSKPLIDKLVARLGEPIEKPFFGFVHFLDAHYPYDYGGKKETPYLSYIGSLAMADAQIGRLLRALDEGGLSSRATIVIMADHGEAFGEHGVGWHASSVYEELIRVPLIFVLPDGKPQVVDAPVSLMDIGPTILDLMGVSTPGLYMGQSLTGFLRGERPSLTRPIVAEARLKRSMVFPDGFKIVHDSAAVELFDLSADPGEDANVYDEDNPTSRDRLGTLEAYFEAHTFKKKGYKVPYRKW